MKEKIAIVADSTTLVDPSFAHHPDFYVANLSVIADGVAYEENVDINLDKMKEFLNKEVRLSTSQPSTKEVLRVLSDVEKGAYDRVYILPLTSHLSGTYAGFKLALDMVHLNNVILVDTQAIAGQVTQLVKMIFEANQAGLSHEEIMEKIYQMTQSLDTFILPYRLDRLRKSGRIHPTVGALADGLHLKLVLKYSKGDEKIDRYKICRTHKKAIQAVVDGLKERGYGGHNTVIYLLSFGKPDYYQDVLDRLRESFFEAKIVESSLPNVINAHIGLNTLGIQAIKLS